MKTNTRLYSVLNCTVHVLVCRRFVCQCFGLSTFRSVDALVCWCFGMSTFWFVAALVLVCRHFGMSVFRFVDVLVVDVSVCRRFDQLPTKGSILTHQILFINMVIILQTTYQNGFLQWHFHNIALLEFYFLNIITILLYKDFILSIFFQHSNILTRASHHWCLASNIVLVVVLIPLKMKIGGEGGGRGYTGLTLLVCLSFVVTGSFKNSLITKIC